MKSVNWKNTLILLATALIWGVAFVAQSVGMDYIEPFTFNCVRSILGGLVLLPYIFLRDKKKQKEQINGKMCREEKRLLLTGGCLCGLALCAASNLQQIGIQYTTVGKAGFITSLYIVLVPILGILLKKKCGLKVGLSVAVALLGFCLLSVKEGFRPERSDIFLLGSALVFSIHILIIDYFSPKTDGVKMACVQFIVCGILSGIGMFLAESPELNSICGAWLPLLYAGVLSSGVAYTLQIVGQRDYNPTVASLILSLESVFSALAGWLLLRQKLTTRETLGCILIFGAIILAQLPEKNEKERETGQTGRTIV